MMTFELYDTSILSERISNGVISSAHKDMASSIERLSEVFSKYKKACNPGFFSKIVNSEESNSIAKIVAAVECYRFIKVCDDTCQRVLHDISIMEESSKNILDDISKMEKCIDMLSQEVKSADVYDVDVINHRINNYMSAIVLANNTILQYSLCISNSKTILLKYEQIINVLRPAMAQYESLSNNS